jgi:hypothetical protein
MQGEISEPSRLRASRSSKFNDHMPAEHLLPIELRQCLCRIASVEEFYEFVVWFDRRFPHILHSTCKLINPKEQIVMNSIII